MCIFHKWNKWEQYEKRGTKFFLVVGKEVTYKDTRQRRYCEKCNKMQDELVEDE